MFPEMTWYGTVVSSGSTYEQILKSIRDVLETGLFKRYIISVGDLNDEWHLSSEFATMLSHLLPSGIEVIPSFWFWSTEFEISQTWLEDRVDRLLSAPFPFPCKRFVDTEPYRMSPGVKNQIKRADRSLLKDIFSKTPLEESFDGVFPTGGYTDPLNCYDIYSLLGKEQLSEITYYHWGYPYRIHRHDCRGFFCWPYGGPQHPSNGRHKFWTVPDLMEEEPWEDKTAWVYPGLHPHIVASHFKYYFRSMDLTQLKG